MTYQTNPTSKSSLIDRLLSQAFTGDLREIAADPRDVKVERIKPHVVALAIAGKTFLLAVHMPKSEEARRKAKQRWAQRVATTMQAPPKQDGLGRYSTASH